MDKKSKMLLILLIILTIVSVGYTFYKTVIKEDFERVNTEPINDSNEFEEGDSNPVVGLQ